MGHVLLLTGFLIGLSAIGPVRGLGQADDLPGWLGESHQTSKQLQADTIQQVVSKSSWHVDPTKVEHLSWKPRAWVYHGFLTDEECDHLVELARGNLEQSVVVDDKTGGGIVNEGRTSSGMFLRKAQARDKLQKSTVADSTSGESVPSEVRTSSGMFLQKGQDEIVARIEAKIAAWTFIPVENGESIQVLRYEHGQKYDPHFDFFHDKYNIQLGGHRIATVLMYLSHVGKGGETVFPKSEPDTRLKDDTWSECAKKGVAVKPKKGDALLFFSLHPDASTDDNSLHGGCPVEQGEKWSATKWMHVASFDRPKVDPNGCEDVNEHCDQWAAQGECEKNPDYMVGSPQYAGSCRKSCKVC
ncbi:Oxoglutarate/iron-dependent oxygenase [Klebsormidium nitens]|uniref:procollagen-proline 4-dioxygenase n=1 Tax=Klebsormidium nitens TaxID=105231 RepID=A0A1Y1IGY0_KLENI|nr:Oxoglutarate/iron-dependent oxygenase [Klebsormidium nitens]|eukprot:GAQ88739.1 Oxoglutarate/iron-dependent oxygenase [Klebsormidium nitens]